MYADSISRFKTMGDVDVVWHDGTYHLFHLVLPNHDFIAHAVSEDGLNWERIENAVFVGHPGSWDDHMLWTMHVTKDPHQPGWWRMFYTGLSRRDSGTIQRIGMARSKDLTHWEKAPDFWKNGKTRSAQGPSFIAGSYDEHSSFPLAAQPPHYEYEAESGRRWISFRDPFYFSENGKGIIIMSARTGDGPFIRRGCVGAAEEVEPNRFELTPPIHHPGLYEDIEVPNLLKLNDRYYLIGSIREDAKVRYWHTSSLNNHWSNFYDNVLLPAGNYAARISHDDRGPLIWNFFTANPFKRSRNNLMPPPKRLTAGKSGQLVVKSFEQFDQLVFENVGSQELQPLKELRSNPQAVQKFNKESGVLSLLSIGGFEAFMFDHEVYCFRFRTKIHLDGLGKCGILFRYDPQTSNGYHLSLDLIKGIAQVRAWGESPTASVEQAFQFRTLQASYWPAEPDREWDIEVVAIRNYIEFSVDGRVILTLSDTTYKTGLLGVYVESACVSLKDMTLEHLEPPESPSADLPRG